MLTIDQSSSEYILKNIRKDHKKLLSTSIPEENFIIPKSQYGFRENVGTEDALAQLSNDTNLANKNKNSWNIH